MNQAGIRYLRVSVTDRCNLRCPYCAPHGPAASRRGPLLAPAAIGAVVRAAAGLGVTKVRVTGGEPLVRADVGRVLEVLSAIDGLDDLALTTNGTLLHARLSELLASRFRRVNVHLDTLDPARYHELTGGTRPDAVAAGIDAAVAAGLRVKLNAVCDAGMTVDQALQLALFALERGLDVRFIEAMPVADAGPGQARTAGEVEAGLVQALQLEPLPREGVARMFRGPDETGRVGFITPSHPRFCGGCDKLRLSCRGLLRTCLFAADGIDLRPLLRQRRTGALQAALASAIARKSACGGREGREVATMRGIGG